MLGEMMDRGASYRAVQQVEDARVAGLTGRISALDGMLADPTLPPAQRAALEAQRDAAAAERAEVPEYRVTQTTLTGDAGSLVRLTSLGSRPLYLRAKGRAHRRSDGEERLSVLSLGGEVGALFAPTDAWVIGLATTVGGYDASVRSFDGTADRLGAGIRLDMGYILHSGWALGVRAEHGWSGGTTEVVRGGPSGPQQVRYDQGQRRAYVQAELMGSAGSEEWGWLPASLALRSIVGVYYLSQHYATTTDNLGNTVVGTFGPSDALGVVRASLAGSLALGAAARWQPSLEVAYDYEFANDMDAVLREPHTLSGSVGLTWVMGRTQRLSAVYTRFQGLTNLRVTNDLSLIATIDF
jgi:hypothetical protein